MALFLTVGHLFAMHLYSNKNVELFKLLNLVGLALDGIGVLLLSNLLLRHRAVQKFIQNTVYIYALGLLVFLPLGIFTGVGEGFKQHSISINVAKPLLLLCGIVFLSALVLEYGVAKKRWVGSSARFKAALLGTFFLMNGFLFQLVGAYLDMQS
jgi:hypothetical protein